MKIPPGYLIIAAIAAIIIVAVLLTLNGTEEDTTAPTLSVLTKSNISVPVGTDAIIQVNYSDNKEVTLANLFYKPISSNTWSNISFINKTTVSIPIPSSATNDYVYYVIVDDAAGNGPIGDPSIDGSTYYTINILTEFDQNVSIQHPVFIEECTSKTCEPCVTVASILHDLYEDGSYPFHYVSLVKQDTKGEERINSFNPYGFPTVVFDGGYSVLTLKQTQANITAAIQQALSRDAPDVTINITAEIIESDTTISLVIKNFEDSTYTGTLKVYVTEIKSTKHRDYNGDPYDYCFVEYAVNEAVSIQGKSTKTINKTLNIDNEYNMTNIMLYAVVFGNEKHQGYAVPPSDYPFDAYYADTVDATRIVEGNLPPTVGITSINPGKLHFFGKTILNSFSFNNTILFGRTTITVSVDDPEDEDIEKVEFYLDGELVETLTAAPYEWLYKDSSIFNFRHTIAVTAYDAKGATSTDEREIIAFILL